MRDFEMTADRGSGPWLTGLGIEVLGACSGCSREARGRHLGGRRSVRRLADSRKSQTQSSIFLDNISNF